uniref:Uncharacterized protein n=1 Tax=Oryza brachyantha TaxID=4533 RepID=J3LWG3_ORYBR
MPLLHLSLVQKARCPPAAAIATCSPVIFPAVAVTDSPEDRPSRETLLAPRTEAGLAALVVALLPSASPVIAALGLQLTSAHSPTSRRCSPRPDLCLGRLAQRSHGSRCHPQIGLAPRADADDTLLKLDWGGADPI